VARVAVNACAVVLFVKVADTFFNPHMYDQLVWMTLGLIGALGSRSFAAAPALRSDPEQR
jgi:hypothetical protein